MKITRLIIKNYRYLKDIDIWLGETIVLISENSRKWRVVFADISSLHTNQAYVLNPSATVATHTMATFLTER